ncbi:MAG: hypothetical protein JXC85_05625 [Candidatus Aenigmarchaeota archaeon]|nr:hypothetical protein [Candidatus Aenigmarchaeota archaeon]
MSYWGQLSCGTTLINERIFYCPLGHRMFRYSSPKFSGQVQPVNFLAVFDGNSRSEDGTDYEFIMGNDAGSGAFTFPNPKMILPFRPVAETVEPAPDIDMASPSSGAAQFATGLLQAPEITQQMLRESQAYDSWLEITRHVRPYHGYFAERSTNYALSSSYEDVLGLQQVMKLFQEPMSDSDLPREFLDGVSLIVGEDAAAVCRKYGIPMEMP